MNERPRLRAFSLACLPALPFLPQQEAELAPHATHLPEEEVVVPLDLSTGHPIVEVVIDGRGPFPMIFDTGASGTMIDAELARELGLEVTGTTTLGDPSNPEAHTAELVAVPELELGRARFEGITAVAWDRPAALRGATERGILGLPTFEQCLFTLDYGAGELRVAHGALPSPAEDTHVVAIQREDMGLVSIPLGLPGGHVVEAHLDSGNRSSVFVPARWESEVELVEGSRHTGGGMRASGPVEFVTGRLEGDLTIGPLTLHDPELRFDSVLSHANVGRTFLEAAVVTVDLAGQRVRVEPVAGTSEPRDATSAGTRTRTRRAPGSRRTLGIALTSTGGLLNVEQVLQGSPAEAAGVLPGDRLVEVDGQPITALDQGPLQRAVAGTAPIELVVLRGEERLTLHVPGAEPGASAAAESGDPQQARLDRLLGTWEVHARLLPAAGADPLELAGRSTFARSHEGTFVHEDFVLETPDGPVRGDAYLAWRARSGLYELTQLDAVAPETWWLTGTWDEDRGRLAFRTVTAGREHASDLRWEYRFEPDGGFVKEMLLPTAEGGWRLASDYRYVRPRD